MYYLIEYDDDGGLGVVDADDVIKRPNSSKYSLNCVGY